MFCFHSQFSSFCYGKFFKSNFDPEPWLMSDSQCTWLII